MRLLTKQFQRVSDAPVHFPRAQICERQPVGVHLIERQIQTTLVSVLPQIAQYLGLSDADADPVRERALRVVER